MAGCLMVLAGVPAAAWAAIVAVNLARRATGVDPAEAGDAAVIDLLTPLAFSPVLSWAGPILAVPVAVALALEDAVLAGASFGAVLLGEFRSKGRNPAGLNLGACSACALAHETGCPLLYVGQDFARTDLLAAA